MPDYDNDVDHLELLDWDNKVRNASNHAQFGP